MNFMDILILAIMVFSIILGFRKGFFKTITGFVALILSLVLATSFHPYVSEYLGDTAMYDSIYQSTYSVLQTAQSDTTEPADNGTGKLNLPRDFAKSMQKTIDAATDSVATTIAETVANASINILSMLLLFAGIRLLILLITKLAGLIIKLPVIRWGDSILGGLFGLLRGLLLAYLVLAIASTT